METLEWSAPEYEEKERSADWFWVLGVIVATSAATSFIYGNYFFAAVLLLGGIMLGFFAWRKPNMILYQLNEKGLKIRDHFYPYENIKSFWVQKEESNPEIKPMFFIKAERLFMPIISIPIENNLGEKIRDMMLSKNIVEEEMREHLSEKIMESLGF